MPKVDLGSPLQLLAQPVQGSKGREKAANPFADLLSSMDPEKQVPVTPTPESKPVEAVAPQQPAEPSQDAPLDPPTGDAPDCAPSANDAEVVEIPAQEQPVDARESASPDQAEPSSVPDAAGTMSVPEVMPEPVESVPQQEGIVDAAPTVDSAKPPKGAQVAVLEASRKSPGHSEPRVSASPAKATSASSMPPSAELADEELAQASIDQSVQPADENATVAKATPAAANVTEDTVSDTEAPRPKFRVRPANVPPIKPDVPSAQGKSSDQAVAVPPAPATRAVEPARHETYAESDNPRQDANQSSQPGHVAYSSSASRSANPTPTPTTQSLSPAAPAAQTQASGSQKVGAGHCSGNATVAAPVLSGAQVKQMALDRLTAQAPLLKQGIEQASFIPQAAKGLAMALRQSDGTITLKLTPGHLGALKIEVTLQGTEVSARMEASTESARQLLIDSQPSLRAALEARGLSVERIEVTAPQGAPAQDARDQRNPGQHQDQSGAGFAGQGDAGRHTGRDAEAFAGGQGRSLGHRDEESAGANEEPWTQTQTAALTVSLDNGGTYRLHLDAVA